MSSGIAANTQGLQYRSRPVGQRMTQQWQRYLVTPMINPDGTRAEKSAYPYMVHLVLVAFSEALCRVAISFVFTLAMASFNAAVIPATLAVLAKAAVLGGCFMIMGSVSSYSRLENIIAAWFPSSNRMFSPKTIQPYADLIHIIVVAIFMYGGSLLGAGLALSVSNKATANLGLPATTANVLGLFGNFDVDTTQIWLTEIYGSAVITFAFLMACVYRRGVKHNVYAGIVMFVAYLFVGGTTIAATGANFDFVHYAAVLTVIARSGTVNHRHLGAYLVGTLVGMVLAWIGFLIVSLLSFALGYTRPGNPMDSAAGRRKLSAQRGAGFHTHR
jgi:hypothetical protein